MQAKKSLYEVPEVQLVLLCPANILAVSNPELETEDLESMDVEVDIPW